MQSFSQFGQDIHLRTEIYPDKKDGYFVEIGAYDGRNMSNTLALEKLGWRGLCIEPNKRLYDQLIKERSCACSPYAVYNIDNAEIEFMEDPIGGCSSIVETDKSTNVFPIIKVPTKRLVTLLEEHNAPSYIEYLSIDTEGSEYEILKDHDFEKYRFGYICVEHNHHEDQRQKIRSLLEEKGYRFYRTNHVDDEYIWEKKAPPMPLLRGLYLNSGKSVCSIHEVGLQCYDILKESNTYSLEYSEEPFYYHGDYLYDFVIINYHFATNNWVTPEYLETIAKRSYAIVTEIMLYGDNVLEGRTPEIFDYYIVLDPSILETDRILAFPRPLDLVPTTKHDSNTARIPIIGSFGFPTGGKAWDQIVEVVNKEFDEAIIRFNIPHATYVPDCEKIISSIIEECTQKITKPNIRLDVTRDVLSRQELVNWCAENTINCFFYFRCHTHISGLSAVTDQAIASGKPLLVTTDRTFRHIHPYVPVYPHIGIRDAIQKTKEGVLKMGYHWRAERFLQKFEDHLKI